MEEALKIGIAGTGRMGAAIATRLLARGHAVTVWNRTPQKAQALAASGATVAATPEELAARSEFVVTMLTDAAAIDATYRGAHGLLAGDVRGKVFIDMSTVRPEVEKALEASARAKGAALVECPVGGTVGPAKEGKLFGFVGGEASDVKRARPVLDELCRRVEHVGAIGAGASVKLAINLPLLVYWQALGESLTICKPLNLPADRLIDILSDTAGTPTAMKGRGAIIAKVLAGEPLGETAFGLSAAKKDLATAVSFAASLHAELPVAASALACFEEAESAGLGDADATTVSTRWPQRPPRNTQ